MVLKPEPIFAAVEDLTEAKGPGGYSETTRAALLSPQGQVLTQALAQELAGTSHLVLICGRYEGVDERVAEALATDEISIGGYGLSGGGPSALVMAHAVVRLLPG